MHNSTFVISRDRKIGSTTSFAQREFYSVSLSSLSADSLDQFSMKGKVIQRSMVSITKWKENPSLDWIVVANPTLCDTWRRGGLGIGGEDGKWMVGPGRNVTLIEELLLYLEKDPTTPSWATSPSESVSQRNIKVAFSIEGASRYINRVTLHNRNSNSLSSASQPICRTRR